MSRLGAGYGGGGGGGGGGAPAAAQVANPDPLIGFDTRWQADYARVPGAGRHIDY
jgi:hypothetical protein